MKAIETRIQDKLAQERKEERDKIAKELIAQLQNKEPPSIRSAQHMLTSQRFGLLSLPSDDISDLMH